jgi:hypothetical protein
MNCLCDSLKKALCKYKKNKNKKEQSTNLSMINTNKYKSCDIEDYVRVDYAEDIEKNQSSLGQQFECCVCMEEIDESLLDCGHNVHLTCIFRSKKIECPLCRGNVNIACKNHIIKCKSISCPCKLDISIINDVRLLIAHDVITHYINNGYNDTKFLRHKLESIRIKNINEILENYGLIMV